MKNYKILENYNCALKDLNKLKDKTANLQREKDFKLTKIEKKYESRISQNLIIQGQLTKIIRLTEEIIGKK